MTIFSTRKRLTALAAATALTFSLAACGNGDDKDTTSESGGGDDVVTLTVGASPVPHGDILKYVADNLAADAGLEIDIVEYTDYVQPNVALSEGDLDANYFQHLPYLEAEIAEKGYDFEHFDGVHIEPYGVYSEKIDNIDDLADGAKVGINNDPSNQARALDLLVQAGVLDAVDAEDPSIADYEANPQANPKNLEFVESEAAALPRLLPDLDIALLNGNYALEGGLQPSTDAILLEDGKGNPYANLVAYKADSDKIDALKKLDELLRSPEVAEYITSTWADGAVIPAFDY
ncbi:MAG: MetQ/NlpA family ABC transporter substrate-binding protein [Bowdeniella nasicola]|nr:MetQ/NlpA family ABC transporter substrate-binding protein [Bowdeniella nasicola]